ncbi:hypothetical protein WJX81_002471 [Elliptochloris bilobata]|uniref:Partial AB-hydrolase lipase domain-containing protein n=1 Tax=Elliptochloris bilobata TaxID=381761 RepID=A0AAW1S4U4_9CHLO
MFLSPIGEWWNAVVLGTVEESVKSFVRESFTRITGAVNSLFAGLVSIFVEKNYAQTLRTGYNRTAAWQSWWTKNERRESMFNAMVHRDAQAPQAPLPAPSPPPSVGTSNLEEEAPNAAAGLPAKPLWWHAGQALHRTAARAAKPLCRLVGLKPAQDEAAASGGLRRRGSELFDRQSGWPATDGFKKRGFLEDFRLGCELAITWAFDCLRWVTRKLCGMPAPPSSPLQPPPRHARRETPHEFPDAAPTWEDMAARPRASRFRRSASFNNSASSEALHSVWTAADIIKQAGYPLEEHYVTTSDGYVLKMERMPRRNARDCVFFMHGVLDTSMGWVSNGITGSQAFAAYDQGFDVWLGNSRANPPRDHIDEGRKGARYWFFTANELGMEDVAAQIDHLHIVKCAELRTAGAGFVAGPLANGFRRQAAARGAARRSASGNMRHSSSLTALDGLENAYAEPIDEPLAPPPNEAADEADAAASVVAGSVMGNCGFSVPGLGRVSGSQLTVPEAASSAPAELIPAAAEVCSPEGRAKPGRLWLLKEYLARKAAGSPAAAPMDPCPDARSQSMDASVPRPRRGAVNARLAAPGPDSGSDADDDSDYRSPRGGMTSPLLSPRHDAVILSDEYLSSGEAFSPAASGRAVGGVAAEAAAAARQAQVDADLRHAARQTPDRCAVGGVEAPGAQTLPSPACGRVASDAAGRARSLRRQAVEAAGGMPEPYRLRAVGHSLGGASLLIYAVMCRSLGRPHHIYRLILLTPAGFLQKLPLVAKPFRTGLPWATWALARLRPGCGAAVYIPSSLLRYLTFKLTWDLQEVPALHELARAAMRLMFSGDASQWDRAMQMPHYNTRSMPAISLHTGMHLIQWAQSGRFQLYDYGGSAANRAHYGVPLPPDIAGNYKLLDIPVDIMAGRADGVIARENVLEHYAHMRDAGLNVTYKEFEAFGHLDFTFAIKDDLRHYVLSRLLLRH